MELVFAEAPHELPLFVAREQRGRESCGRGEDGAVDAMGGGVLDGKGEGAVDGIGDRAVDVRVGGIPERVHGEGGPGEGTYEGCGVDVVPAEEMPGARLKRAWLRSEEDLRYGGSVVYW